MMEEKHKKVFKETLRVILYDRAILSEDELYEIIEKELPESILNKLINKFGPTNE